MAVWDGTNLAENEAARLSLPTARRFPRLTSLAPTLTDINEFAELKSEKVTSQELRQSNHETLEVQDSGKLLPGSFDTARMGS